MTSLTGLRVSGGRGKRVPEKRVETVNLMKKKSQ